MKIQLYIRECKNAPWLTKLFNTRMRCSPSRVRMYPSRMEIFFFVKLGDVVDVCGYPPNQADHTSSYQSHHQSCQYNSLYHNCIFFRFTC